MVSISTYTSVIDRRSITNKSKMMCVHDVSSSYMEVTKDIIRLSLAKFKRKGLCVCEDCVSVSLSDFLVLVRGPQDLVKVLGLKKLHPRVQIVTVLGVPSTCRWSYTVITTESVGRTSEFVLRV